MFEPIGGKEEGFFVGVRGTKKFWGADSQADEEHRDEPEVRSGYHLWQAFGRNSAEPGAEDVHADGYVEGCDDYHGQAVSFAYVACAIEQPEQDDHVKEDEGSDIEGVGVAGFFSELIE